jgi:sarcosine oxidase
MIFHTIVAGLGAMGSAALYHLAKRGRPALGLDRLEPPHTQGSSHGETRVIREAYFEHPSYVPFVQRAYDLWSELQYDAGSELYYKTGGLMIGHESSSVLSGSIRSAREHRLPHELLGAAQIRERHPALNPDDEMFGLLEPRAGLLYPEKCIRAHLELAQKHGSRVQANTVVLDWQATDAQVLVRTNKGEFRAEHLILAAGPWITELVPQLASKLQVERQVLLWFEVGDENTFSPERLPIHLWEYEPNLMFYGFPNLGDGLKLALHHQGEITDPEHADCSLRESDVAKVRDLMRRYLPKAADAKLLRGTVCLYTNSPDGHFIIDHYPAHPNVVVASPCSGHGFKFASAVGEVLAQLACDEKPPLELGLFAFDRLLK